MSNYEITASDLPDILSAAHLVTSAPGFNVETDFVCVYSKAGMEWMGKSMPSGVLFLAANGNTGFSAPEQVMSLIRKHLGARLDGYYVLAFFDGEDVSVFPVLLGVDKGDER